MVLLNQPFFHLSMADNVIAFRCSSVIYPHLLLSPSHFQNSLFTFSIERVNGIPLWDIYQSDFQRALKIRDRPLFFIGEGLPFLGLADNIF